MDSPFPSLQKHALYQHIKVNSDKYQKTRMRENRLPLASGAGVASSEHQESQGVKGAEVSPCLLEESIVPVDDIKKLEFCLFLQQVE